MILDGHIHTNNLNQDKQAFLERLNATGIEGGTVISYQPNSFGLKEPGNFTTSERLENLLALTKGSKNLYPFYWIDPLEEDALEQVKLAVASGVAGFKVICNRFYPKDKRAMEIFRAIAKLEKPILFHSGILWDGRPTASFNRPGEFEALLDIDGLKFCLAHISWPWVDECIAVYGKFLNANNLRSNTPAQMFIDITPGTPPIYREEALRKLFTVGYDVENNIIFGSDSSTGDYNESWVRQWIDRDNDIYSKLGLNEQVLNGIYSNNLMRFVGAVEDTVERKTPKVAE